MSGRADVIVVGLGAWGSAAAYHLARRGLRVLGFDRHVVPHTHGSSHHRSRGYRTAAPEGDAFVPLLLRAGELYDELSAESGSELLRRNGCAYVGRPEDPYIDGTGRSLARYDLPYELLDAAEAARRFPEYPLRDGEVLLFEPAAGVVFPEPTIEAHVAGARRRGADLRMPEEVVAWTADDDGVSVTTAAGVHRADRLVIAAGPWAEEVVQADLPISVERQVVAWLPPGDTRLRRPDFPYFLFPWPAPCTGFYGFPDVGGDGVKVALHHGGEVGRFAELDRAVRDDDLERLRTAVRERLPLLAEQPIAAAVTCWYTNSPDHLYLIGAHPAHERVVVATGDSGRGFKLAPVVGELIADLVQGVEREAHELVRIDRFAGRAA